MALSPRLKVLASIDARPHVFRRVRAGFQTLTLAILVGIPASGLARFDLWRGHHRVLFHAEKPVAAFFALMVAMAGFYLLTFIVNGFMGRAFCGFGCPIGQVSRLADSTQVARHARRARLSNRILAWGYSALLAAAVLGWWLDPAVLLRGSPLARATAAAGWLALAGVLQAHGEWWRWRFCQRWCPIGLYYSAVQLVHQFGVHFASGAPQCERCRACVEVCPVELDPKDLAAERRGIGGLAIDGFASANHCLTCGDCVRACELVSSKPGVVPPLRLGLGAHQTLGPVVVRGVEQRPGGHPAGQGQPGGALDARG
jgi:polyferredoxin